MISPPQCTPHSHPLCWWRTLTRTILRSLLYPRQRQVVPHPPHAPHVPVYLADPPVVDHTLTPPYARATLGPPYLIVLTFLGKEQPLHACVYFTHVSECLSIVGVCFFIRVCCLHPPPHTPILVLSSTKSTYTKTT